MEPFLAKMAPTPAWLETAWSLPPPLLLVCPPLLWTCQAREKGYLRARVQGCRVQGYLRAQVQGCLRARVKGYLRARLQGKVARVQGYLVQG